MLRILRFMFGIDVIESRWMAYLLTASVAHACSLKGIGYLEQYHGWLGWLLFALSPLTAVVIGVNLINLVKHREARQRSNHRNAIGQG
jgi:heme/copper-type cytochrome/quinol oxidase subunit 2